MIPRSMRLLVSLAGLLLVAALLYALNQTRTPGPLPPDAATPPAAGRNVVLWISIDGLKPDDLERAETPFLDRLRAEGIYSRELQPVFPSLTFPGHVSQATGVKVGAHGITGNSFYDSTTGEIYNFPNDSALLQAEPIWITASRQGVRTAVQDWPLSYLQTGPVRSDYFGERYEGKLTDQERLQQLVELWQSDTNDTPLQLVMGYIVGPDSVGHRTGPGSDEVLANLAGVDRDFARFFEQVLALWTERMSPVDTLYVLLTTDHGMDRVEKLVNIEVLPRVAYLREVRFMTGGNVGHIFLDRVPETDRPGLKRVFLEDLRQHEFAEVYPREELPERWDYAHATRVGDLVVVLANGYTFSRARREAVYDVALANGPYGMHGYDVTRNPEMNGAAIFWRHPERFRERELGVIDSLQLHPTVARLLGIKPAPAATATPLELR